MISFANFPGSACFTLVTYGGLIIQHKRYRPYDSKVTYGGLIIQHQRYRPYDSNSDLWGTNNPTSTKHTHKTKDRVTRTPLKNGDK